MSSTRRSSANPGRGRGRPGASSNRTGRGTTPRKTAGTGRSKQPTRSSRTTRSTTRVDAPIAAAQLTSSRAKLTGRAAVLLLVVAVLAVSYASSVRAYLKQRSEINALNAEIADKRADVQSLTEQKARLHDPAYIEKEARQRFGWILPGEVSYRVIGIDGEVLSDGGSELSDPARPVTEPDPEWWQDVYGTVQEAGESEKTEGGDAPDGSNHPHVSRDPGQKTDR